MRGKANSVNVLRALGGSRWRNFVIDVEREREYYPPSPYDGNKMMRVGSAFSGLSREKLVTTGSQTYSFYLTLPPLLHA